MLSDILNVELKQTRFYQDVFAEGQQEGRHEGKQEECIKLIVRLIRHKLGICPQSENALQQLPNYSIDSLEELAEALLNFQEASDLTKWLDEHKPDGQN